MLSKKRQTKLSTLVSVDNVKAAVYTEIQLEEVFELLF